MAYKNKEKQREFQRKWASKKRQAMKDEAPDRIDSAIISFEELQSISADHILDAHECIEIATKLNRKRVLDRLEIAALAIQYCRIQRGGSRRGKQWEELIELSETATDFAIRSGIKPKTLHHWIRIYREIAVHIKNDSFDYTLAGYAIKESKSAASALEKYHSLKECPRTRSSLLFIECIRRIRFHLNNGNEQFLTKTQKDEALEVLAECLNKLSNAIREKHEIPTTRTSNHVLRKQARDSATKRHYSIHV